MARKKTRKQSAKRTRNAAIKRTQRTVEFTPDYSYVIKDLKRIGILAGTFIALLVFLSFILG